MRDDLLLIKGHFFFLFAALGPILPFLSVLGKQLGVSETAMGLIYTIIPIFYFPTKILFGFIVDYFVRQRTFIFTMIVYGMGLCYLLIYFIPAIPLQKRRLTTNATCVSTLFCDLHKNNANWNVHQICSLSCENGVEELNEEVSLDVDQCITIQKEVPHCNVSQVTCNVSCEFLNPLSFASLYSLYKTQQFWLFVLLLTVGTISFNIVTTVSDTICFNALGNGNEAQYGKQRLWGTVGYGITAFLAGYYVDHLSKGLTAKNNTPAFVLLMFFISLDIIVCSRIKMVPVPTSNHIPKETWQVLKKPHCLIFTIFSLFMGMLDGFTVYYLFLYLEEIAKECGLYDKIRLIEGLTVLAQSFGGELLVFVFSEKVFKTVGYETSFALCFLFFALRFCAFSKIPNPWWILPIEVICHGLTYTLAYCVIVAYTSSVSSSSIRGTMQGIATGIYDGIGYSLGGLVGGTLCYFLIPLRKIFAIFSVLSLIFGILYYTVYMFYLKKIICINKEVVYIVPAEDSSKATSPFSEE